MKHQRESIVAAGAIISIILLGTLPQLMPNIIAKAQADEGETCSVHTLNGVYGIQFEGMRLADKKQYVSVSLMRFGGRGIFTVKEIGRFDGQPVNRTFTGPYTVNPDCSGYVDYSSIITNPAHQAHGAFVMSTKVRHCSFWMTRTAGRRAEPEKSFESRQG